jgi:hypothetical protein
VVVLAQLTELETNILKGLIWQHHQYRVGAEKTEKDIATVVGEELGTYGHPEVTQSILYDNGVPDVDQAVREFVQWKTEQE